MRFPGKGNGFVFRKMPTIRNESGREFTKDDFLAPLDRNLELINGKQSGSNVWRWR